MFFRRDFIYIPSLDLACYFIIPFFLFSFVVCGVKPCGVLCPDAKDIEPSPVRRPLFVQDIEPSPVRPSVSIPDSVTSIGNYGFAACSSLTNINIPDSVTSIGASAFFCCTSLENITIPVGVTSIGDYAFGYCPSLESITIPDSVTSIGKGVFHMCDNLETVYFKGTEEQWNDILIGERNEKLSGVNIIFNYVPTVCGDLDGDGAVSLKDVLTLRKYLVGIIGLINVETADANGDGGITVSDILVIRKYLAGIITEFPVEK